MKTSVILILISVQFLATCITRAIPMKTLSKGIKHFKKFKRMKELLKIASHGALPTSVIGDIAMPDHGNVWSFNYFDNKFDMIASNLKLLDSEVKAISGFVEALEQTTNNHRTTQIIVGSISLILISVLVGVSGYLCRKNSITIPKENE